MRQEAETRARRDARAACRSRRAARARSRPADGVRIVLQANIERSDDVAAALSAGAEGIGLYRSEFMLVGGPPDMAAEDEQYHVYRQLVERMAPRPVTIRTFDIDERQLARPLVDAALDARWFPDHERVGHAGLRGIRFGLAQPAIFKTQLRALLRAAAHGPLRIMFPFVSSVQEVRAARALLAEARAELAARGIETPARAGRHHDRGAVGGVHGVAAGARGRLLHHRHQRSDPVHAGGRPHRRARVRSLRAAASGGAAAAAAGPPRRRARSGIPVSVCGEMASDPLLLRLLIGCGLTEFSMTPGALPMARRVVAGDARRRDGAHRRARADARHRRRDRAVPARRRSAAPASATTVNTR